MRDGSPPRRRIGWRVFPGRAEGLIVRELADEVVVYDTGTHRAHCLNPAAARVFRHCDGRTSVDGITRALRAEGDLTVGEHWVRVALEELAQAGLLRDWARPDPAPQSRRAMLRAAALGATVLLPAVVSIVAPTPAEAAATCVKDCTGQPFGTPCSSSAPSGCFCSCDGFGACQGGC
jgi:coenzyme PQQ synthesis protein D (PqqD)